MHVRSLFIPIVAALISSEAAAGSAGVHSRETGTSTARTVPLRSGLIIYGDPPGPRSGAIRIPKMKTPVTGLIIYGDPPGPIAGAVRLSGVKLKGHAKVSKVTWIARDGATLSTRLEGTADLADVDSLVAPAGDWTDIRITLATDLVLDGQVDGAPLHLELDMGTWDVALDQPVSSDGDLRVGLSLSLPEDLLDEARTSGGLDVFPGDDLHDAVVVMVEDATIGSAR